MVVTFGIEWASVYAPIINGIFIQPIWFIVFLYLLYVEKEKL